MNDFHVLGIIFYPILLATQFGNRITDTNILRDAVKTAQDVTYV